MRVVQGIEKDCWKEFVDTHPHGNIFHSPEMFQVFVRARRHHPFVWAVVDGSDRLIALLCVVQVALFDGPLRKLTTRAIAYGSVLAAPGIQGQEALGLLLSTYNRQTGAEVLFTELRNVSGGNEFQHVLAANGFTFEGHLNFLIGLDQSEEDLWRKISKTGQQRIRSAYRKDVIIEEVKERCFVSKVYPLLTSVYSRAQVPLADISLFEAAYDFLAPQGMFKIFLSRLGDTCIGARFLLMHNGRMIDWYAAADRNYSSYSPNELLVWHILKWGRENDFKMFDFGGAGKPDEAYGPREFKAKFGGNLVNFGRHMRVHAPVKLKMSQTGYQLIRKLF